ncbi:hypothetical protein QTP88_023935 [Uroleucon formosanum]
MENNEIKIILSGRGKELANVGAFKYRQVLRENCKRRGEESMSIQPLKLIRHELLRYTELTSIVHKDLKTNMVRNYKKKKVVDVDLEVKIKKGVEEIKNGKCVKRAVEDNTTADELMENSDCSDNINTDFCRTKDMEDIMKSNIDGIVDIHNKYQIEKPESIDDVKLVENNDYSKNVVAGSSKHLCLEVLTKNDDGDINMHMLEKSGKLYTMTGEATGYSTMSVRRIVYEGKKNMDLTGNSTLATFITPDKKRNNVTKIKALVDDFDRCALKRTITNMYTVEKIVPTVKLIFEKQKNFMNLGSTRTLNRIISEMGFKFRKRLIIVHAGGEEGFVPNALLTWEAQSSSGDYYDNMNKDNYYKCVTEKLLPNLSKNSVVVLDNATYHCHQSNRAPNSNSLKKDMINWLTENNISFNSTMFKPQLYDIIRKHKQVFIKYSLDGILSKEGHDIIRLPPYHPDLNPIEMIWSQKNESYMDIEMDKLIVTYGEDTTDDSDTSTEDEDDDLGVAPLQP